MATVLLSDCGALDRIETIADGFGAVFGAVRPYNHDNDPR
jgi:hypothetical protein